VTPSGITATKGAGNAGTITDSGQGTISDSGSFTNSGTLDLTGGVTVKVAQLTNSSTGLIESGATSGRSGPLFGYGTGTTAGTIDNYGTLKVLPNQYLTIGPSSCAATAGEDLVTEPGSVITVSTKTTSTFTVACGTLDLAGGTVPAGPLRVTATAHELVTFDQGLPTGAGGMADTVRIGKAGTTVKGSIPKGWTVDVTSSVTVVTGASNAGTIVDTSQGTFADSGSFTNSGTFDLTGGVTVKVAQLTNSSTGLIESGATSGRAGPLFGFGTGTTAGTIHNYGTLKVLPNQYLTIGPSSCAVTAGEDLVTEPGSVITVSTKTTSTFTVACGTLDLAGGSVPAGPVRVTATAHELVNFDQGLPTGTGGTTDTVRIGKSGATMKGAIPKGWTVDLVSSVTVAAGASNAGTIVDTSTGTFTDNGAFTNSGTFDVTGGPRIAVSKLTNTSTGLFESGATAGRGGPQFAFGTATSSGTIDNYGTLKILQNQYMMFGAASCGATAGENLVAEVGSVITASATTGTTFKMVCGTFTVDGGTVAAGPVQIAASGHVNVTFTPSLPKGAGGSKDELYILSAVNFTDSIPAGWTVLVHNGTRVSMPDGDGNNGTMIMTGGTIADPGTFVNNGTITGSESSHTVPAFINAGTLTVPFGGSFTLHEATFANRGTVKLVRGGLNVDGFTQTSSGTLALTIINGAAGDVTSFGQHNTVAGTLALTTSGTLPTIGNIITVVTGASTVSGTFTTVTGAIAGGGVGYSVTYLATGKRVQLTVISASALTSLSASGVSTLTPATAAPGQRVSASFTVTNTGTQTAAGSWIDSLYLASGSATTYQPGDILLEKLLKTGTPVAPGGHYTDQVTVTVPVVPAGTYHLIAVPDSYDLVAPTSADQQAASPDFTIAPIPTLTPGVPVHLQVNPGTHPYFQIAVPATSDVRVAMTSPPNEAPDVYARAGTVPSGSTFTLSSTPHAATPTVILPKSTHGTWYIEVKAGSGGGSYTLTVTPSLVGLGIDSVSPSRIGNVGAATITIRVRQGDDGRPGPRHNSPPCHLGQTGQLHHGVRHLHNDRAGDRDIRRHRDLGRDTCHQARCGHREHNRLRPDIPRPLRPRRGRGIGALRVVERGDGDLRQPHGPRHLHPVRALQGTRQ
jgi:hypothetical protein